MPADVLEFSAAVKEICQHREETRNPDYKAECYKCGEHCCVGCAWCRWTIWPNIVAELCAKPSCRMQGCGTYRRNAPTAIGSDQPLPKPIFLGLSVAQL